MHDLKQIHHQMLTSARIQRFREIAARRLGCLTVVFENIGDSHNVNACVRSAEAFGLARIFVVSEKPYKPLNGISMYADRWIDVCRRPDSRSLINELKREDFTLVGTVADNEGVPLHNFKPPPKTALVMGNEAVGISSEMRHCCDQLLTIPTAGFTQSLNISTATAICLHQLTLAYRRRGNSVFLSEQEQKNLVFAWCDREIRAKLRKK